MLNFACNILGDNPAQLRQHTVQSRRKVLVVACLILLSTFLWFMIGYFTASKLLNQSPFVSLISGAVTGSIIFIIERSIALSQGSRVLIAYRFVMGFLVALIGSVLLDSLFFQDDIDFYMTKKGAAMSDSAYAQTLAGLEPEIMAQKATSEEKYNLYVDRQDRYEKEVDGTGGSKVRGRSVIALQKERLMQEAEQEYKRSLAKLQDLEKEAEMKAKAAKSESLSNLGKKTLLYRIQCLHEFVTSSIYASIFYWALFLMNLLLELGVIMFKSSGNKTSYELEIERAEEIRNLRSAQILKTRAAHYAAQQQVGYHGEEAHRAVWNGHQ